MSEQAHQVSEPVMPEAIPLFSENLMAEAVEVSGLSDFGDMGFTTGLEILATSLREEANLREGGKIGQSQEIIKLLVNRLRYTQKFLKKKSRHQL